jgi:beta-lactamase regulating signal transducer with metallopeptidase domain/predicted  nucleic acid-binding Zn-ribbon protein
MTLLLVKVSVILATTLVAARLLHRAPASARHQLWSLAFGAMLLLPAFAMLLPALPVPVPAGWDSAAPAPVAPVSAENAGTLRAQPATVPASAPADTGAVTGSVESQVRTGGVRWPSLSTVFVSVWVIGMMTAGITVLLSLSRVHRLMRSAEALRDDGWLDAAAGISAQLGVRYPVRLLLSAEVGTPMAGGLWRPAIFLPLPATSWTAERRDLVLAHELAHLAGRDPLRHLMTRLSLACYWFHPLAWLAAREAGIAREQACDETVLAMGARPSAYARVLLDLAESVSARPARLLGALPMVHRSHLETRLMAILNVDVRSTTRRLVVAPAIGVALLTLTVAAATPFEATPIAPMAVTALAAPAPASPAPAPHDHAAVVQARESACVWDAGRDSFMGSQWSTRVDGRMITDRLGSSGGDRIIQRTFGDLRICVLAEGLGDRSGTERPSQWIGRARRVVMEAHRGGAVQRLEFNGTTPTWQVGGATRSFDAAAGTWRDRMFAVLDPAWELSILRGEESALHGQISAIHGQRSALQGEISALQGAVSAMQGRISAAHGEESSLQGKISAIQGHVSALQGAISAQQGAISSLNATRYDSADRERIASRIADRRAEIARIEREIREYGAEARIEAVRRQIAAFNARDKSDQIAGEIRAFDLDGKVAAIERRITALKVEDKVAGFERQIEALDVPRRAKQLEDRIDAELPRLTSAIAAIR